MITDKTAISKIVTQAYNNRILVPAFNFSYIPMIKPILEILKQTSTFAIGEVALQEIRYFGIKSFQQVAEEYFRLADRKFSRLHLDHIPVIDENGERVDWKPLIEMALKLEFDSVMIDGSRLSLEENISVTRKVVELAHNYNVPVEAELGAVFGHEEGFLPPYEELFATKKGFTAIREAERFVKETGVNWLSVAIGNVHGAIIGVAKNEKKISARLDIEHLKRLVEVTGIPLVLHGGSGIKANYAREAIRNGITKINIGHIVRRPYEVSLSERPDDIEEAQRKMALEVKRLIQEEYKIERNWEVLNKMLE